MAGTTTYYGISYPTSTDYVKDGATAMQTIADGFDSAVAIPTYNNQTGTSYTFVLADAGKTVTSNNASAVTFTIPPQASVAWANNTTLTVRNLGAGIVTIAGGAGVTVTNTAQTVAQYGAVRIIRTASNAWTVVPASGTFSPFTLITNGTVSAQSNISLSNVLSDDYKFYEFRVYGQVSSSGVGVNGKFRENTTDKSTGYSNMIPAVLTNGTVGNWDGGTSKPSWNFARSGTAKLYIRATIFRNSATEGLISFQSNDPSTPQHFWGESFNTSMTNFNGLSFYPNSGTFTGSYTLIGYN